MVEPLYAESVSMALSPGPHAGQTYQFPEPITVTLCFLEYAPRVAIFAAGGGAIWLVVWANRRTAWLVVVEEAGMKGRKVSCIK